MKTCTKCSIGKDHDNFPKRKSSSDGLSHWCRDCTYLYKKEYREKNKESIREKKSKYYLENKHVIQQYNEKNSASIKERKKEYRKKNSVKIYQEKRRYIEKNKEKVALYAKNQAERYKPIRNAKHKSRKNTDPVYKMKTSIPILIIKSLKKAGFCKQSRTYQILGCSFEFFKSYIEAQFQPWMNWENHGKYNGDFEFGWDLDHIIPLSSAKTEEEVLRLNHYTNFQPLCSKVNRYIKHDKLNFAN